MLTLQRAGLLARQIVSAQNRAFTQFAPTMAKLDINSKLRMNSGHEIPILGYGVYQTPARLAEEVTEHAIKVGYRHVDSATVYRNEKPSAKGMLQAGVTRDQLFFTSKVPPKMTSYKDAKACVAQSLRETGLDYIDLYLLHAPYGGKEGRLGAWKALIEAVDEGRVRSIGVSNYGVHHLEELEQWAKQHPEESKHPLSVNQIELHPWLARPDIVSWCKQRGVVLEAYSPLVRNTRADDPLLAPLTKKYHKSPAQILLRWSMQMGFVCLPKSVTPTRIEENIKIYDFELTAEDMASLDTKKYEPCAWDPTTAPLNS